MTRVSTWKNQSVPGRTTIGILGSWQKYFQAALLVLQLITNRGLVSVPGRTNQSLEGPQWEYVGSRMRLQIEQKVIPSLFFLLLPNTFFGTSGHFLTKIGKLCLYQEVPFSTWNHDDRNMGVLLDLMWSSRYWLVFPGTDTSHLFVIGWSTRKGALEVLFVPAWDG